MGRSFLLLLALGMAIPGVAGSQTGSDSRPPQLTDPAVAGLDIRAPLLLRLEWQTLQPPGQAGAVAALLARHGFTVERSMLRAAGGDPLAHTLSARRVDRLSQDWLERLDTALRPLVAGEGELRWTLEAAPRDAAPPPKPPTRSR